MTTLADIKHVADRFIRQDIADYEYATLKHCAMVNLYLWKQSGKTNLKQLNRAIYETRLACMLAKMKGK